MSFKEYKIWTVCELFKLVLLFTTGPPILSTRWLEALVAINTELISCKITESWKLQSVLSPSLENIPTPLHHKLSCSIEFFTHVTFTCIESTSVTRTKFYHPAPTPHQVQPRFNPHPSRIRTHGSANSRIRPAFAGLTRFAKDSTT